MPDYGGDTLFASMYAAYDALSDGLKKTLEGLRALHSKTRAYQGLPQEREVSDSHRAKALAKFGAREAVHPVAPLHPESGRRLLFVNPNYTTRFEGWTEQESEPLLTYLYRHAARPEFTYRFQWQEGSIAFWDNRSTAHLGPVDLASSDFDRRVERVTIAGDLPVGPDGFESVPLRGELFT